MTPAQLQALREGLPAFADAEAAAPAQREFCRYYGIDFVASLPALDLDYRLGTVTSGPYTLAVHRWLQAGASSNLLLLHGYYDHSGLFGKLIEYGLWRNCNVLIFDLPGHGLSTGVAASIDDFAEYGQAVKDVLAAAQRLPDLPLWVMAQSTGCAALVEYARRSAWPFAAAVLLAPLLRPYGWGLGRLAHALVRPFTASIERKFTNNSGDSQFLQFLQRDPLQSRRLPVPWVSAMRRWMGALPPRDLGVGPALIVQGDADHTVDWQYSVPFYQRLFPGSKVVMLHGAGHQLANETNATRQQYLEAADHYLQAVGLLLPPQE